MASDWAIVQFGLRSEMRRKVRDVAIVVLGVGFWLAMGLMAANGLWLLMQMVAGV